MWKLFQYGVSFSPGWMDKFKKRYGIRLKSCRGERPTIDNIAFNYDDDANEAATNKNDAEIKSEDVLYEPAFVTVNNLEDELFNQSVEKNETNNKEKSYEKVMNCVDEVMKWSVDNHIEPLYLTMLKSLRERIRYQART